MRKSLLFILLSTGLWQVSGSVYMLAKAWLLQFLIHNAWEQTFIDKKAHKPWSWADTHPIAYLTIPRLKKYSYILSGSSGRNLAFSATHMHNSGLPGEQKSTIISGHNDSHFEFLQSVLVGDIITLRTIENQFNYTVSMIKIVDSRLQKLAIVNNEELVLTTCYPFNSLSLNNALRYVIYATPTLS